MEEDAPRLGDRAMKFSVERITLSEANAFVRKHHRHHGPTLGHIFSIGAAKGNTIHAIAIVGRPVSRMRDDGVTAEISRLCSDGERNACSFLYGAASRAAFALGFKRIGTYIRADESGMSLNAANWRKIGETPGRSWNVPSRPRIDKTELCARELWEISR